MAGMEDVNMDDDAQHARTTGFKYLDQLVSCRVRVTLSGVER